MKRMNGRYGSEIRSDLTSFCAHMCSLSLFDIDMNSPIQLSFLLQLIKFSFFLFFLSISFCPRCRKRKNRPGIKCMFRTSMNTIFRIFRLKYLRSKFHSFSQMRKERKVYWSNSIWCMMLNWRHFIDRILTECECVLVCVCICFIPNWQKTFLNPSTSQHLQHTHTMKKKEPQMKFFFVHILAL